MVILVARGAGAADSKKDEARRLYDEATAAFGVGNYAEAADKYEASFKLHPDAALLFNAAQAYRMADNKQRALQLYHNFLRLYGANPRAEDARTHVAALEKAIADADTAAPPAPPVPPPPPPAASLSAPPPQPQQPPPLIERQAPPAGEEARPLVSRPWFWVAVGAVVVGGVVAAVLATRKDTYPDPTLGRL
jgi:tetratricopeptide (TPR) repeat protein